MRNLPSAVPALPGSRPAESRRGFSLPKFLALLALAGLFAASVAPVRAMIAFQRLKQDARRYAEVIERSLENYQKLYGIFPLEVSAVGRDYHETTTNAALIATLFGTGEGEPPLGEEFGIDGLPFIDGGCRLDGPPGNQRLLDPWGNEFHVRMDADEDGYVGEIEGCAKVPNRFDPDPTRIKEEVIVWSKARPKADGVSFGDCSVWLRSWDEEERKQLESASR